MIHHLAVKSNDKAVMKILSIVQHLTYLIFVITPHQHLNLHFNDNKQIVIQLLVLIQELLYLIQISNTEQLIMVK